MRLKLSAHAFTRFWDVHAWSGVVGGLLLYFMFLTGSITLFHKQLEIWEEPLRQQSSATNGSLQRALEHGLAAAGPTNGSLWLYPPEDGIGAAKLGYEAATTRVWNNDWIDTQRGVVTRERERLSSFLFELHFLWHDSTGDWLYYTGGALALTLLLALVTGVLIHLKDLVRQFQQFRPNKAARVIWSDLHKVLGVMGLPFQLLYAFSGAFIVFAPLALGAFVGPVFGGDEQKAERIAWNRSDKPVAPGAKVPVLPADTLLARARAAEPELLPHVVELTNHGHENGEFEVYGQGRGTPYWNTQVRVRERDGQVIEVKSQRNEGAMAMTRRWIMGLHFANFGGMALRFLFFGLGLATCVTLLTGNWIWLARREGRRASLGNRLLSKLTLGIGVGCLLAVAALFLASRLFPLEWTERGTAEEATFLGVLALVIGWAFAARNSLAVWWQGLAATGLLLLATPAAAARFSEAGLFGGGPHVAAVFGIELTLVLIALVLFAGAGMIRARC